MCTARPGLTRLRLGDIMSRALGLCSGLAQACAQAWPRPGSGSGRGLEKPGLRRLRPQLPWLRGCNAVKHRLRHGGEARRVGTRAASLQLVTDLTVWSEMLSEDISRVTILARAQGHESSCNDSTRICIILLTTQVAGQILRLHHDPQSPHPLENPQ